MLGQHKNCGPGNYLLSMVFRNINILWFKQKLTCIFTIFAIFSIGYWKCSESFRAESFHWQIGCAVGLWWLSQIWVNNHIWFPKSERLAKVER